MSRGRVGDDAQVVDDLRTDRAFLLALALAARLPQRVLACNGFVAGELCMMLHADRCELDCSHYPMLESPVALATLISKT